MINLTLRPVYYRRLIAEPGYEPDQSEQERTQIEEDLREKKGWFHGWTQISEKDPHSENYLIAKYGIIEKEDGQLETFPHEYFRFISKPE
ncbi:MAG: hypothetical protein HDR88_00675 [Bacteroides sp.]|nr:hypothetical protein [Bacteroides sp.]